jgi:tRNA(Arg) A34 adenosine deaminase TadA
MDAEGALAGLDPAVRRSLELAHLSAASGGLAVGAVLSDADAVIVAEGRNRAYDPPGGPDVLQGTPIAHAETNVLAAVATERDLGPCTLVSTHEPCVMCAAAAEFTGVGRVLHVAPDPSDPSPGDPVGPAVAGPDGHLWVVVANVLFLGSVAAEQGLDHPMLARARDGEPETAALVAGLVGPGWPGDDLAALLTRAWDGFTEAGAARRKRLER